MGYFNTNYLNLTYPLQTAENERGFRLAQIGAIHAASAHFATRNDPGIVTMPTGSGKTAVLIATAFALRAKRVLIITPSRLVREQIADEVKTLATLRAATAISENMESPRVFATKQRITTEEQWEHLRDFDVVVSTIQSISPEYQSIPEPPQDLFDLILIDEAHHSPARTWRSILDHFRNARQLLFTATPFRQDKREIAGRFIFTYDLRKAYEDGIFGEIRYQPINPDSDQNHDVAIACSAERQFHLDAEAGFQHRVMVRTDSRKRASELKEIYDTHTNLRLRIITGEKSLKYVKSVITQLNNGELDGIICVNMLGEGFNFPSLKIAAIHSPHRSLSVTLQFIGRFARTAGAAIGPATFLAIPSDIEIETERLYDARAVWQDMVQNLSASRVNEEAEIREILQTFTPGDLLAEDLADLSLYVLEPYYHVKVYQLNQQIDLRRGIQFPDALDIVYQSVSEEHNAAVYITRETSLPRWTTDDRLAIIRPDLFVFHQDPASKLIFVCASRRSSGLYEELIASFADADPRPLPLHRLNRALNDLQAPEFFNIGMRNRVTSSTTESYRIIAGSNADKAIVKSDGRLYHRGHVFGRASEDGSLVTIGLSSASKIWSNKSSKLPELISWCKTLAQRISSDRIPVTGSGLDYLDVGEEISELPNDIIGVDWPAAIYRSPPIVQYVNASGTMRTQLLDLDLEICEEEEVKNAIVIQLTDRIDFAYKFTFSFQTDRFFEPLNEQQPNVVIDHDRDQAALIDFINDQMPHFYTSDLSFVQGYSFLKAPLDGYLPLNLEQIIPIDWIAKNVDITTEFGAARRGYSSIHIGVEALLHASNAQVVYYDHGTGEVADFIALTQTEGRLLIEFYHCKSAGSGEPGHRLADIYEIAGQTVKSVTWASKQRILLNVRRRFTERRGSHRFIKGNLSSFETMLGAATPAQIEYEYVAVQPGLRKQGLPANMANILAAASDHLVRGNFRPLRIWASL